MEPTTNTNKTKIAIIVAVVIVIIIGIILIIRFKKPVTPVTPEVQPQVNVIPTTVVTKGESDEMEKYIDSATTFDNESYLAEIEKEFK